MARWNSAGMTKNDAIDQLINILGIKEDANSAFMGISARPVTRDGWLSLENGCVKKCLKKLDTGSGFSVYQNGSENISCMTESSLPNSVSVPGTYYPCTLNWVLPMIMLLPEQLPLCKHSAII